MNSYTAFILLAAVCYASGEIFLGDSSFAEKRATEEKDERFFFIPLFPVPVAAPAPVATPVAAPVAAPLAAATPVVAPVTVAASTLANCPARCCKKYCKDGVQCAPGVPPVTLPTCASGALAVDSGQCYSPETTGCGPTVCNARSNCRTNCGNVIDVLNSVAFCP